MKNNVDSDHMTSQGAIRDWRVASWIDLCGLDLIAQTVLYSIRSISELPKELGQSIYEFHTLNKGNRAIDNTVLRLPYLRLPNK